MIAEYMDSLVVYGAGFYRNLFWEAGLVGQVLYLEAEEAGIRATGIGCYFDDPVTRCSAYLRAIGRASTISLWAASRGRTPDHAACVRPGGSRMNTPTFELDWSPAEFVETLDVDSPMMQAPERRWLWSCLRRRRAHCRFRVDRGRPAENVSNSQNWSSKVTCDVGWISEKPALRHFPEAGADTRAGLPTAFAFFTP